MKFQLVVIFTLVYLATFTIARPAAEDEYAEYEDEPAPPPPPTKKSPVRSPLASRRNPLANRNNKATSTTAAPPPKPAKEEVAEDVGDEVEDEEPIEPVVTSTEAPKKFLKAGIVRPFRSNDDLLATLKRRREQAVNNKSKVNHGSEAEESAPAPVQNEPAPKPSRNSSTNGRRRFNAKNNDAQGDEQPSTSAPARTSRRFRS